MIRRLTRCIREYKWPTLLSPLCMAGEVIMELLIPLVMASLYKHGVQAGNMEVIVQKSLLLALCAMLSLGFGIASAVFAK